MAEIEKRCVECGTQVPTISDTPLCSKDCQVDYAFRMVRNMSDDEAWCPTCNKQFESVRAVCYHHNYKHSFEIYTTEVCENCDDVFRPSNAENNEKYCSEKCFGEAISTEVKEFTCENCSERFTDYKTRDRKYCSESCFVEVCSTELKEFTCENCSETFTDYKTRDREYCSLSCSSSKEHHPRWEGGSNNIRKSPEYYRWKKAVLNKYDCCQSCGSEENLQAHHKVPVSENKELATEVSNGTLLCDVCHSNEHQDMPVELFVKK